MEAEFCGEIGVDGFGRSAVVDAFELIASFEGVVEDATDAKFVAEEPDDGTKHGFVPKFEVRREDFFVIDVHGVDRAIYEEVLHGLL